MIQVEESPLASTPMALMKCRDVINLLNDPDHRFCKNVKALPKKALPHVSTAFAVQMQDHED